MSDVSDNPGIDLQFEEDNSVARLLIAADCVVESLTRDLVLACARERGMLIDADVEQTVNDAIAQFTNEPKAINVVIARSVPSVPGENGRFDWVCHAPRVSAVATLFQVLHLLQVQGLGVACGARESPIEPRGGSKRWPRTRRSFSVLKRLLTATQSGSSSIGLTKLRHW